MLDTNVIVAAMRSPTGASAELLRMARRSEVTLLVNVALALEYEATCKLAEHRLAAGLDLHQVGVFVDAVLAMAEPVETHFMWRPQLRDPADEFVLEAAVNGQGKRSSPSTDGISVRCPPGLESKVLTPAEAIRRIKT